MVGVGVGWISIDRKEGGRVTSNSSKFVANVANPIQSCLAVNAIMQKLSKSGGVVSEVGIFSELRKIPDHRSDRIEIVVIGVCVLLGCRITWPGMYGGVGRAGSVIRMCIRGNRRFDMKSID